MNRERMLLAFLGGSLTLALACGGSASSEGNGSNGPAPISTAQQIAMIAVTQPDNTEPADLSEIDLSKLDPDDLTAFDDLFR